MFHSWNNKDKKTMTILNLDNLLRDLQDKKVTKTNDDESGREKVYDPHGNRHTFQYGTKKVYWDPEGKAILPEFTTDPLVFLNNSGGDFNVEKAPTSYFLNGEFHLIPNSRTIVRVDADGTHSVLTDGVTKDYNTTPYRDIIRLPDVLKIDTGTKDANGNQVFSERPFAIDLNDFDIEETGDNPVRDFLQQQDKFSGIDLNDHPKVMVSDLLTPWGCSVWQNGKQLTFQYKIGSMSPNTLDSDDKYDVYLTIMSSLDGTVSTKFFLTIVRVFCKNTNAHAVAQGWMKLSEQDKLKQSIKRTSKMQEHQQRWYLSMMESLSGSVEFLNAFKRLSRTRLKSQADFGEVVTKLFKIDLEAKGQGKRGKSTFERVIMTMRDPKYTNDPNIENWLQLYNGLTAYIQHGRQVNNLPDGSEGERQREEKLQYKLMVERDTTLAESWKMVQQYAGFDSHEMVKMTIDE